MKKISEEKIQEFVEAMIRLGTYGITVGVGWKLTNVIAEREISKNSKINELEIEVLELKHKNIRDKILKL